MDGHDRQHLLQLQRLLRFLVLRSLVMSSVNSVPRSTPGYKDWTELHGVLLRRSKGRSFLFGGGLVTPGPGEFSLLSRTNSRVIPNVTFSV